MADILMEVSGMLGRISRIEVSPFHKSLDNLKKFTSSYESNTIGMKEVDHVFNNLTTTLRESRKVDFRIHVQLIGGNLNITIFGLCINSSNTSRIFVFSI